MNPEEYLSVQEQKQMSAMTRIERRSVYDQSDKNMKTIEGQYQ